VYRVIMTHFSQRYPKLPAMSEKLTGREAVAFDLMSVNLADLDRLPLLLKPLELLLAEESASMEAEVEDGAVPAAAAAGCCADV
jgi:ribonuclease Z